MGVTNVALSDFIIHHKNERKWLRLAFRRKLAFRRSYNLY
jgi:hypothetical protein